MRGIAGAATRAFVVISPQKLPGRHRRRITAPIGSADIIRALPLARETVRARPRQRAKSLFIGKSVVADAVIARMALFQKAALLRLLSKFPSGFDNYVAERNIERAACRHHANRQERDSRR